MSTKPCSKCKSILPVDQFYKSCKTKSGLAPWCISCSRAYRKQKWTEYRLLTPAKERTHNTFTVAQQELYKLSRYNLSKEDYDFKYTQQEGRCAICNRHESEFKKRLHVDHDHMTGDIRGLLCQQCNVGLGNFSDSCERLTNAKDYLTKYKTNV